MQSWEDTEGTAPLIRVGLLLAHRHYFSRHGPASLSPTGVGSWGHHGSTQEVTGIFETPGIEFLIVKKLNNLEDQ